MNGINGMAVEASLFIPSIPFIPVDFGDMNG
jgi:hypothetical protein